MVLSFKKRDFVDFCTVLNEHFSALHIYNSTFLFIPVEEFEAAAMCEGEGKPPSPIVVPATIHPPEQETPKPMIMPSSKPAPKPAEGSYS